MKNKIFLGGTCRKSEWRKELIPLIQVDFFNPIVENRNQESIEIEEAEKKICNVHLYVISTPESIYSIAESVQSSLTKGVVTILHVIPLGFNEYELKRMIEICNLVIRNGSIAYVDDELRRSARVLNNAFIQL